MEEEQSKWGDILCGFLWNCMWWTITILSGAALIGLYMAFYIILGAAEQYTGPNRNVTG
jgi:hypothetical protein